ncbi:unnamed protein product [Sphagnum balticum]
MGELLDSSHSLEAIAALPPPLAVALDEELGGGLAGVIEQLPGTLAWHMNSSSRSAGAASAEVDVGGHAARCSSRGARGGGPPGSAPPPAVRKKVLVPQATRDQGYGRIGRPVELLCNHFAVKLMNMTDIYHYNVTITPESSKKVNRDVMNKLRTTYGAVELNGKRGAYDGEKGLFMRGPLNFSKQQKYYVLLADECTPSFRDFTVCMKFVAKVNKQAIGNAQQPGAQVDSSAQDALRVLDIVLWESAFSRGYLLARDNFFHPSLGQLDSLGEGVEAWCGFHSRIRATQMGLTLDLDTRMMIVIKPIMVEELIEERLNM